VGAGYLDQYLNAAPKDRLYCRSTSLSSLSQMAKYLEQQSVIFRHDSMT